MNGSKKRIVAAAALVLLVVLFAGVWIWTRPATSEGSKSIRVEVVHSDGTARTFTYQTDEEYLGEVLLAEGLVAGDESEYGLYVTEVDGETASWDDDGAYWAFYVGEDYAELGVDQTVIADGDEFSLVYTVG